MRLERAIPIVLGTALGAALLVATAGTPSRPADPPLQPAVIAATDFDLARQVERLAMSLENAPEPRHPARNPFNFDAPVAPAASPLPLRRDRPAADLAPLPEGPTLTLSGVAEENHSNGLRRIAVISSGGEVFLVGEGDLIRSRYRVERVESEVVRLLDLDRGSSLTLVLK